MRSPAFAPRLPRAACVLLLTAGLVAATTPARAACIAALDDVDTVIAELARVGGIGGSGLSDGFGPGTGNGDGIGGTGFAGDRDAYGMAGGDTNGSGIGGTGYSDPSGGVGGTGDSGAREGRTQEGIGGTGYARGDADAQPHAFEGLDNASLDRIRAAGENPGAAAGDTRALRGVLTQLGGECAYGERVEFDGSRVVDENGDDVSPSWLRVGQVVGVEALAAGSLLHAVHVGLDPLLSGPVTAVDAAAGRVEVLGQGVEVGPLVPIEGRDGEALALADIQAGDSLVVHGARRADGSIVATWLARQAPSDIASVRGFALAAQDARHMGTLRVGGVVVSADPSASLAAEALRGTWVRAVGRWDASTASVTDAHVRASTRSAAEVAADALATEERILDVRVHLGQLPPTSTR